MSMMMSIDVNISQTNPTPECEVNGTECYGCMGVIDLFICLESALGCCEFIAAVNLACIYNTSGVGPHTEARLLKTYFFPKWAASCSPHCGIKP